MDSRTTRESRYVFYSANNQLLSLSISFLRAPGSSQASGGNFNFGALFAWRIRELQLGVGTPVEGAGYPTVGVCRLTQGSQPSRAFNDL